MTCKRPRFWRTSLFYFASTLLSKLAVFLLLPLYTAKIPVSDMGFFDTATALAILLAATLFLDVGIGVMRFYLAEDDCAKQREIFAAGLLQLGLSLLLYVVLGLVLVKAFAVPHGTLVVLYGASNALFSAAGYFARAKGQSLFYAVLSLVATLLQVGLNLYLLLVLSMGYEALYISFAIGTLVSAFLMLLRAGAFSALGALRRCRKAFLVLLRFSLPLGGSAAAFLVLTSGARVLTTLCLGTAAGGVVAVAIKLSQVAFVVGAVLRFAWQEVCFAKGASENGEEEGSFYGARISWLLRTVLVAALLFTPLLRVWLWLFPSFIAPSYFEATRLLPVVLLGALLSVVSDFLEPTLAVLKKTGLILMTCVLGAVLSVVTTLLAFAAGLGTWGAAVGFCVGFFATAASRLWLLSRLMHVRLRDRALLLLPFTALPVVVYLCLPPLYSLLLLLPLLPLCIYLLWPFLNLLKTRKGTAI